MFNKQDKKNQTENQFSYEKIMFSHTEAKTSYSYKCFFHICSHEISAIIV